MNRAEPLHGRSVSFWRIWLTAFLPFLAFGALWILGQPIFSGADEYEHASEAQAVFTGQVLPRLAHDPRDPNLPGLVRVHALSDGSGCFVAHASVSAGCDQSSLRGVAPIRLVRDYVSSEPPLPALLTGLPLLLAPDRAGFYASRFLTAAFGAGLLATSVALALRRGRRMLLIGLLVAMTPCAVAEFGVLGSSFLEIGLVCLLWTLLALLVDGASPSPAMLRLLVATCILLLLSRPLSFIYVVIALSAFAVSCERSRLGDFLRAPGVLAAAGVTTVVLVFAVAWFVFAQAPLNPNYLSGNGLPHVTGLSQRINLAAGNILVIWEQMVGATGANEYNGPALLHVIWLLVTGAILGTSLVLASRRVVATVLVLTALLFAIPFAAEVVEIPTLYLFWQGRYSIPIFAGLMILSASALDNVDLPGRARRRLVFGVVTAVGIGQALEWCGALHRFVVGTNGTLSPLAWASGWRPPVPSPLLLVGGIALSGFAYGILYRRVARAENGYLAPATVPASVSREGAPRE